MADLGSVLSSIFGGGGGSSGFVDQSTGLSDAGFPLWPGTPPVFTAPQGAPNIPGTNIPPFPGAPSGGGGFNIASILPLIGAAPMAINAIRGLFQGPSSAEQALPGMAGVSGPLRHAGAQQLKQYESGNLSPTQQAAVDRMKQEELAKWRQYLASAGIPESSAMADIENKVTQDAQVYANQLLQQNYTNALQSLGLAQNSLGQQATINFAQDAQNAQQLQQLWDEIGKIFANA